MNSTRVVASRRWFYFDWLVVDSCERDRSNLGRRSTLETSLSPNAGAFNSKQVPLLLAQHVDIDGGSAINID